MSEPLRWAILGAGKFALTHMGPAIHQAEGAVLAGLGTSDPAKAARFEAFAGPLKTGDYDTVLADPDIDVVYIATPNSLHTPLAHIVPRRE